MARRKPEPRAFLCNPRPIDVGDGDKAHKTSRIAASDLDDDESTLRRYLRTRQNELVAQPRESEPVAVSRIIQLAVDGLIATGAAWWSGYRCVKPHPPRRLSRLWGRGGRRRYVAATPPRKAEHKCIWLDTSQMPARIKQWDRPTQSWKLQELIHDPIVTTNKRDAYKYITTWYGRRERGADESWPALRRLLRRSVLRMLRNEMGRAGKDGRTAFLACATIASLLDVTPERVRDFLGNHRYPRRQSAS